MSQMPQQQQQMQPQPQQPQQQISYNPNTVPSYPASNYGQYPQQQQQSHRMLAERNSSSVGQLILGDRNIDNGSYYVTKNTDKPLQQAIDAAPAPLLRPESRDIFLEAEQQQWKPSRKHIDAPRPVAQPQPGNLLGNRRVGPYPIDNTRAGAPSEVIYREDRGLGIVPPPVTQEEQTRGIRVVERPNRNPLLEGDIERPHGLRRSGTYNAESGASSEWKYAPGFANSPKRRIAPPHVNANDVIGVNVPAGTFTGNEQTYAPSLRPVSAIVQHGEVLNNIQSHDDVISYSYAGEINPTPAESVQRNPDKPTTYGGYIPPEAQTRRTIPMTRRERKPAPWMQSSINIGTDATRVIASYADPRTQPVPTASSSSSAMTTTGTNSDPNATANAATKSATSFSNQLYELNKRRYTRDSGPFF